MNASSLPGLYSSPTSSAGLSGIREIARRLVKSGGSCLRPVPEQGPGTSASTSSARCVSHAVVIPHTPRHAVSWLSTLGNGAVNNRSCWGWVSVRAGAGGRDGGSGRFPSPLLGSGISANALVAFGCLRAGGRAGSGLLLNTICSSRTTPRVVNGTG